MNWKAQQMNNETNIECERSIEQIYRIYFKARFTSRAFQISIFNFCIFFS